MLGSWRKPAIKSLRLKRSIKGQRAEFHGFDWFWMVVLTYPSFAIPLFGIQSTSNAVATLVGIAGTPRVFSFWVYTFLSTAQ